MTILAIVISTPIPAHKPDTAHVPLIEPPH
jgi:hypothetical protein